MNASRPMRARFLILFAILVIGFALPARAASVTSIDGREVVIRPPAATSRAKVGTNAARRVRSNASLTVTAGADTSAAINDYRRIQDAINQAVAGNTITLSGNFDFTAPNAMAAWALGNDNTAATGDDYSVIVPPNINNVTVTATSLGSATIQGPGDLATLDLEGFLYFDGTGDNQGWTISNLQIFDFDLGIGMFFGVGGGADAYNNTIITNNLIRIPEDLNVIAAPGDTIQNIGIHYAFGTNQSIDHNTIQINGGGTSNGTDFSSEVGMQSNTSGGAVYDGLSIEFNTLQVVNAQSAQPQVVLGIWENGHAHTSDISVSSNSFVNNAVGNDPSLNIQRAFRVTSHSSLTTIVRYQNNDVDGANIGMQWITLANYSLEQSVLVAGNTITDCGTGVLVQSSGLAHLENNAITGSGAGGGVHVITGRLAGLGLASYGAFANFVSGGTGDGIWIEAGAGAIADIIFNDLGGNTGFGLNNQAVPSIFAERNWWGNNLAANVAAEVSGTADFTPWLASGTDVSPPTTGFQAFIHATTTGTLTTFVGTFLPDVVAVTAGNPVTFTMNGQSGTTLLAELLDLDVLTGDDDDTLTLGATGVPTDVDMGTGLVDLLIGPNVGTTYNVTGPNSGTAPGVANTFINVENLAAGTGADFFVIGAIGTLGGSIDGNLGVDTMDVSAVPLPAVNVIGPGSLDGVQGTASPFGSGFDNINLIVGSPADLSVLKTGPATANAGSQISYTIDVTNNGPNAATGVTLTDTIPAGATFQNLLFPGGWSCMTPIVGGTGTVTCTRASMPVGLNTFTLVINAPASTGTVLNTATVTSGNEGNPGDESSTATTTLLVADLSISKTGPATVAANQLLTYTIAVTNNGPMTANNVVVTDVLPAGVTFDSATPSQGSCSGTTTVTCNLGTLTNGAGATITLVVLVTATTGTISNTATVTATEFDPTPANSSTSNATVGPALAAVPSLSTLGLFALFALLALLAVMKMR